MTLTFQIITGLFLSINYIPSTELAFQSVIHIMRDVDSGWAMRYSHMNGASLFFTLIFIHIGRGVYYGSPVKTPLVWVSGVLILLISIIAAFIGYVLPWGQISYWGATVITSMLSSIPYVGGEIIIWLWGDFSVSQPTLNRIFSFHFIVPLLIVVLVLLHLSFLHFTGSSNPIGLDPNLDKTSFYPMFLLKDVTPLLMICLLLSFIISISPDYLGDPENFNLASISSTPTHIKPEWYFLFAYAILRCIPSKLGGVVAMGSSILVLLCLTLNSKRKKFFLSNKLFFWSFCAVFILLTWAGGKPVNDFMIFVAQILTFFYFFLYLIICPLSSLEYSFFKTKVLRGILLMLIFSSLIGLIGTQWVVIWVSFEVNTLTMCFLLTMDSCYQKKNNFSSFIYYAVQLFTSFIVLWGLRGSYSLYSYLVCLGALLIKIGSWPFHIWYLKLILQLKSFYRSIFLLITWQKLLPIFVASYLIKEEMSSRVVLLVVAGGVVCPLWGFSNFLSFNRIIGLSSVNNNRWFILLIFCSFWFLIVFFCLYSYSLSKVMFLLNLVIRKSKKLVEKSWWALLVTSNLGGLPPLPMFWAKVMFFKLIVERNFSKEFMIFIILVTCYFIFLYLNLRISSLSEISFKNNTFSYFYSKLAFILTIRLLFSFFILFKKSEQAH